MRQLAVMLLVAMVMLPACAAKTYTWVHPNHHDERQFREDNRQCKVYGAQIAQYCMKDPFAKTDTATELLYGKYVACVNAGTEECMVEKGYSFHEVTK